MTSVTGPTTPGIPLGARNTSGPFWTAGGAGGGLLSIINCAPRDDISDRRSMCHQAALTVRPFNHFGAVNDPIGPFISDFWLQPRISTNALLDLVWGQSRKRIGHQREVL